MSGFDSYDCATCGEPFAAHSDGNAAAGPYCSPACETAGKGLD